MVVQIVLWITSTIWVIKYYYIDSMFLKFILFGISGILFAIIFAKISVAVGVLDNDGNPTEIDTKCVDCGEPIGKNRLKVKPDSKLCIDCQSLTDIRNQYKE